MIKIITATCFVSMPETTSTVTDYLSGVVIFLTNQLTTACVKQTHDYFKKSLVRI